MTARGLGVQPETIERIRALAATGIRRREVAEQMGMPFSTLCKVAARHAIQFHGKSQGTFGKRFMRPAKPPPIKSPLSADTDAIARYIAEHGVTRCPPAFAAPSPQGARP